MSRRRYKRESYAWLPATDSGKITALVLMLVFVCPLGLYVMWSGECKWKAWVKGVVSGVIALALGLTAVWLMNNQLPNAETESSVVIVEANRNKGKFAPFCPDDVPDTAQLLKLSGEESTLISTPTATPEPIWVYSNDNGLYYHTKECRFVYETTPRVTLRQALEGGRKACTECNPPDEL